MAWGKSKGVNLMTVDDIKASFPKHDQFLLRRDEPLRRIIKEACVPNAYGVYLVYAGLQCTGYPIYIGKSGTMKQDGSWKTQGLAGRLVARQGQTSRDVFFQNVMRERGYEALAFLWFVTHDGKRGLLPCLVEAQLLQRYYEQKCHLPLLNEAC